MKSDVGFKNLKVSCVIGVYPEERVKLQDLFIDVSVVYDISNAAISDDVSDAINYVEIADLVERRAIEEKFQLIESLMAVCLKDILEKYNNIEKVRIKVKKPSALENAEYTYSESELTR